MNLKTRFMAFNLHSVEACQRVNSKQRIGTQKTVTKKRKMLISQDFSVEIYCNIPQFVL